MKTKTTKSTKAAAGQNSGYIVTNGVETYPAGNDRSNANRKAKKLTAKNPSGPAYEVKPAGSSAPTVAALQAAVNTASAAINGAASNGKAKVKKAKASDGKAKDPTAVITGKGGMLYLVRKSTGGMHSSRQNREGAVERLLAQATKRGLVVENEAAARKLEIAA